MNEMSFKDFLKRQRLNLLWLGTLVTIGLILFQSESFPIVEVLNRNWMAFKQSKQLSLFKNKFRPSHEIALLQFEYSNRVDFWFDDQTRKELGEALQKYQGPIVLGLDPMRVLKDPFLKSIFENPNIIRPVRLEESGMGDYDPELEKAASVSVLQDPTAEMNSLDCLKQHDVSLCTAERLKILPDSLNYFLTPYLSGFLGQGQSVARTTYGSSNTMSSIFEIPLKIRAARREIPTSFLGALSLTMKCKTYVLSRTNELKLTNCEGKEGSKEIQLTDPLPLFFYDKRNLKKSDLKKASEYKGTLIVELIDSASYLPNIHGEKYSWGELMATALSNTIQGQTSLRTKKLIWGEKIFFILALLVLIIFYRRLNLMRFLEAFIIIFLICISLDFAVTVLLNFRTEPMNELFSIILAGFVGVAVLSKREFERRSLIERALSGYVSAERLVRLTSGKEPLMLFGKRKELTTLLLDIEGFSAISKEVEIENVFRFIQSFFSVLDPIIFEERGVIDKKTGDGMLAFFGDSDDVSPKDAANAAVLTAFKIQEKLSSLPDNFFGLSSRARVRIGVNTGEMMVGNTGSKKHFNYTVLGEAVNFTQRLEAACPAGAILIGEKTFEYVKSSWSLEKMQIHVKHEELTATAYKVLFQL